jgi:hypothetical protein
MPLIKFNLITANGNYVMLFTIIFYKFYLAVKINLVTVTVT